MVRLCARMLCLWLLLAGAAAAQSPGLDCERAGVAAERAAGLPSGLLLAIGQVESGRFDSLLERRVPWPWAVDVGGTPLFFANATDAVAAVGAAAARGLSADVGCFQISLLYHPHAFTSVTEAFDPGANARYAAGFLTELYARTGSWAAAVALYHSATPALGEPYAARVLAAWRPGASPVLPAASRAGAAPVLPAVAVVAGVRVITPSGTAGYVVTLASVPLPRVIIGLPEGVR